MRFLTGLILLAFPVAEIFLLIQLGQRYGWWLALYLVVVGYLGLQLIRGEKQQMSAKMMQSMTMENIAAGANPVKAMLGSARNMVAGVLLIIPGVLTDIIAAILLLIPIAQPKVNASANVSSGAGFQTNHESTYKKSNKPAANDDIIEGEFVEIKEDTDKNK